MGTTDSLAGLGEVRNAAGRAAEGEPPLRECVRILMETAPGDFGRYRAETLLGDSLRQQRRFAEAQPLLLSGYQGLKSLEAHLPAIRRPKAKDAGAALVALYRAWGKPEQTAQWRERAGQTRSEQQH